MAANPSQQETVHDSRDTMTPQVIWDYWYDKRFRMPSSGPALEVIPSDVPGEGVQMRPKAIINPIVTWRGDTLDTTTNVMRFEITVFYQRLAIHARHFMNMSFADIATMMIKDRGEVTTCSVQALGFWYECVHRVRNLPLSDSGPSMKSLGDCWAQGPSSDERIKIQEQLQVAQKWRDEKCQSASTDSVR